MPDACLSFTQAGTHFLINQGDFTFDTTLLCLTGWSLTPICKLNPIPPDDILIFSTNTGELFLFENLSNEEFECRDTLPLIGPVMLTDIADFNNDGYDDYCYAICWWYPGCTDSIYISINDQNWSFHEPQQYYVGPMEIFRTESADLNGDNFSDIIMFGYSPRNAFKILWNDGFGRFGYENPVGIKESHNTENKLNIDIRPNPFTSFTYISMKSTFNSKFKISIVDLYGRPIKDFKPGIINIIETLEVGWDGTDNSGKDCIPGVYIVILEMNGNQYSHKIIHY